MFNYNATQIFIVQPRFAGGGMLSFILSLDSHTGSLNFKNISVEQKLADWKQHVESDPYSAHLYDYCNFGHQSHLANIQSADWCDRYIHKHHFFELDAINNNKQHPLLPQITGKKIAIGIYLTDECIEKLKHIQRKNTTRGIAIEIDFYQKWIYSNQKPLLKDFYSIETLHYFPFSDMLDQEIFLDHLLYCKNLLNSDIDLSVARDLIQQWHSRILKI